MGGGALRFEQVEELEPGTEQVEGDVSSVMPLPWALLGAPNYAS